MNETSSNSYLLIGISSVHQLPMAEGRGTLDLVLIAASAVAAAAMWALFLRMVADYYCSRLRTAFFRNELSTVGATVLCACIHVAGVLVSNGHFSRDGNLPAPVVEGRFACSVWIVWVQYGIGFTPWITLLLLRLIRFGVVYDRRLQRAISTQRQMQLLLIGCAAAAALGAVLTCLLVTLYGVRIPTHARNECSLNESGKSVVTVWVMLCVLAVGAARVLARDAFSRALESEGRALRNMLLVGVLTLLFCLTLTTFNALLWQIGRVLFSSAVVSLHLFVVVQLVRTARRSAKLLAIGSGQVALYQPTDDDDDDDEMLLSMSTCSHEDLSENNIDCYNNYSLINRLLGDQSDKRSSLIVRDRFLYLSEADAYDKTVGTPLARALFFSYCLRRQRMITTAFAHGRLCTIQCRALIMCWYDCDRLFHQVRLQPFSVVELNEKFNTLQSRYLDRQDQMEENDDDELYIFPTKRLVSQLESIRRNMTTDVLRSVLDGLVEIQNYVLAALVENVSIAYAEHGAALQQKYLTRVLERSLWLSADRRKQSEESYEMMPSSS